MARIAHLILAHKTPEAVARLVGRLPYPGDAIFVHIDKKVPVDPFAERLAGYSHVHLVAKRTAIRWGAYSMVDATLKAMEAIIAHGEYDFVNLLSESDYPLKTVTEFHEFLDRHIGKSFMEMHFEGSPWWEEAQQKIARYHFVNYGFPGRYLAERFANAAMPQRTFPRDLVFTGRSQWMTLSMQHVRYVLDFTTRNPEVIRFFKHTWGPDEFFFQTLLYSSKHRQELIHDSLRYVDWSEGKVSPKILVSDDMDALGQSGKFFARKFDASVACEVLDFIDADLLGL